MVMLSATLTLRDIFSSITPISLKPLLLLDLDSNLISGDVYWLYE